MGRKKKFKVGEVVTYGDGPATVVDYRQDGRGRGEYRVVRLVAVSGGKAYGPAVWVQSHKLDDHPWPYRRSAPARAYRANERLGPERGCSCNCCPHVAIPASMVQSDGTFKERDAYVSQD